MRKLSLLTALIISVFFIYSCQPKSNKAKTNKTSTEQTTEKSGTNQDESQYGTDENNFIKEDLEFSIWFPENPKEETDTIYELGYPIPFHSFVYSGDDFVYMVAVGIYPSEVIEGQDKDQILVNVMQGFVGSQNLTIDSKKKEKIQDEPALLYKAYGDNFYMIALNVFYGNKIYQIIMAQPDSYPDDQAVNDFIGSFKLLK